MAIPGKCVLFTFPKLELLFAVTLCENFNICCTVGGKLFEPRESDEDELKAMEFKFNSFQDEEHTSPQILSTKPTGPWIGAKAYKGRSRNRYRLSNKSTITIINSGVKL